MNINEPETEETQESTETTQKIPRIASKRADATPLKPAPSNNMAAKTEQSASTPADHVSKDTSSSAIGIPTTTAEDTTPIVDAQAWHITASIWRRAIVAILPTFLLTRILFLILTYFGGILFTVANYTSLPIPVHDMLYNWNRWDVVRFLAIADKGYVSPDYAALFPLYPTLLRLLTPLIPHKDMLIAGMLLSNIAFFGVLVVLYRLVESEWDSDTAKRATLYLAIFPTAMFFFAGYSDALFLLVVLLSFYALRRGYWWLAGLFGGLAALTNVTGVLLFVIFLYEFFHRVAPPAQKEEREQQQERTLDLLSNLPASLLIPLGLGIYAYGLYKIFGKPLAFLQPQSPKGQLISAPWTALLIAFRDLVKQPHLSFVVAHTLLDLTAFVLFLVLLVLCFVGPERFSRGQQSLALFGLLLLAYALFFPSIQPYDALASMQHLVLAIFAGCIILARYGRRSWFHQGYLMIALPMLAFFTLQFITGHWTI